MTAKERLTDVIADLLVYATPAPATRAEKILDAVLDAHPDLLLTVLAETGVLIEQTRNNRSIADVVASGGYSLLNKPSLQRRFVSPWVPSGDQT